MPKSPEFSMLTPSDIVRRDTFLAGHEIGETFRTVLSEIGLPDDASRRVAIAILGLNDQGSPHLSSALVQGMWHGFGEQTPPSILREEITR